MMEVVKETCNKTYNQICFSLPPNCIIYSLIVFYFIGVIVSARKNAKEMFEEDCKLSSALPTGLYIIAGFLLGLLWPIYILFLGCFKNNK